MTIWEGIDYNKHGQLTFSSKGGIRQRMETGYLKSVTASDMQSFGYHYDALGNMDHRYDHLHKVNGQSLHEQFYYDRRNQLTDTYLNGTLASHIIYDNLGNITSKTATGGFEYQSGNSPYRLTAIVPDQNIDPGYKLSQNITYTDFNKVESITGNGYKLEIEYGLKNQRISQSLSSVNQSGQTTLLLNKHFIGGLQEKIFYETGTEKTISYITSPEGLTAIEVKSGITGEWYTVFTDHLGSITTLVRESDGLKFELSYDAWGNRRDPATWTNYSGNLPDFIAITDSDFITDRGFSRHEHLDMFGLINMNGRVYDPVIARFLSPDSFIQAPGLAQNYNGYTYCLNNPLVYTDPDGEWIHLVIGAVVGGIQGYIIGNKAGLNGWELVGTTLAGAGIGALSGGVGASVATSSGVVAGAVVGGTISGAGMGLNTGIATGQGFGTTLIMTIGGGLQGGILGLAGGTVGGAIGGGWGAFAGGATAGGLGAAMNGGSSEDILKGAALGGAMSFGMYHLNTGIAYKQYKNSGVTFDEKILSYRQFTGMSADFQRSKFWENERGGYLVGKKYVRYPAWTRHKYSVDVPNSYLNVETWATFHTHWDEPGKTVTINGKTFITSQYHSPQDYSADDYLGISSIVINKYNASFNSQVGRYSMPFSGNFYRNPFYLYYWGYNYE